MESSTKVWQDLRPRDRMEHLLQTGHLSDCSFVVYDLDGTKINLKCHKFVLMCASPVFERMFEGDFEESRVPDNIVLDDINAGDFRKFIDYLYWQDSRRFEKYELPTLQNLVYLSKKFMISVMTRLSIAEIIRRVYAEDTDAVVDLYQYAQQIESQELIDRIISRVLKDSFEFLRTAAIYDLSSEVFLNFMSIFEDIDELLRFNIIEKYCKIHGLIDFGESKEDDQKNISDIVASNEEETPLSIPSKETCQEAGKEEPVVEETFKSKDLNDNDKCIGGEASASVDDDKLEKKDDTKDTVVAKLKQAEEKQRELAQRKKYLKKLLKIVKFGNMSSYSFCLGPGKSKLMTVEKKYKILAEICVHEYQRQKIEQSDSEDY